MFKNKFETAKYLVHLKNFSLRQQVAKFRCSDHKLMIEVGRHKNIALENRGLAQNVALIALKTSVTNERGFVGRVGRVGCEFICGWLWVCGFDYCGFVSL